MIHAVTNPTTGEVWTCTGGEHLPVGAGISAGWEPARCTELELWDCSSSTGRDCHLDVPYPPSLIQRPVVDQIEYIENAWSHDSGELPK